MRRSKPPVSAAYAVLMTFVGTLSGAKGLPTSADRAHAGRSGARSARSPIGSPLRCSTCGRRRATTPATSATASPPIKFPARTARSGRHDQALKAYEAAGADALMAPGLPDLEAVRAAAQK